MNSKSALDFHVHPSAILEDGAKSEKEPRSGISLMSVLDARSEKDAFWAKAFLSIAKWFLEITSKSKTMFRSIMA